MAYVLSGVSIVLTLAVVTAAGVVGGRSIWMRAREAARVDARDRFHAGLRAGVLALIAYDLSRWALVESTGLAFRPFEAFGAFGQGLVGSAAEGWWVVAAGAAFHIMNGIGFAVAYAFLAGPSGPVAGVAFALGLEACMVLLYPQWLRLQAVDEFLQVSIFGHVVYGVVLGFAARAEIRRRRALRLASAIG